MMLYAIELRDQIFVKGYGFFSFAKNMDRNLGKSMSKNLSGKYSQKLLDHAKKSTIDAIKIASKNSRSIGQFKG